MMTNFMIMNSHKICLNKILIKQKDLTFKGSLFFCVCLYTYIYIVYRYM